MVKQSFIAVLFVSTLPMLAEVTATLSQNEISEFETVQLTITLKDLAPRDDPDFSALNEDFDIERTTQSSSTTIVNGVFTSIAEWYLVLRPKRIDTLTIPELKIGNHTTEELTLKVLPISDELSEKLGLEVFWITNVDRTEQYVHGGIHVERKLYYTENVNLVRRGRSRLPVPQDIENAHVVILGEQGSNWGRQNDRSYNIYSHEFVVFAERSGTLKIPEASIFANITLDGRSVSKLVRSEVQEVTILPKPDQYPPDAPWMPATNVLVKDDLGKLNLSSLVVGDSFTRQITIEALESYSTGIPGLEIELPEGIRTYPVTPEFRNQILGNKIIGMRSDEQAFVVTQAGEFQIPDAELIWWNTNKNVVERTVVPGRTFTVQPNPDASFVSTGNNAEESESTSARSEAGLGNSTLSIRGLPIWVVSLAVAGWVLSIVLAITWIWDRRQQRLQESTKTSEDIHLESLLKSESGRDVKEGMVRWLTTNLAVSRVEAILLLQKNSTTAAVLSNVNDHQYGTSSVPMKLDRNDIKRALRDIEEHVQEQRAHTTTFWQFYQPT